MAGKEKQTSPKQNVKSFGSTYPSSSTYAKRRRQKKIALLILAISATGTISLGILAFLGRISGQFTIKMDPVTTPSFLRIRDVPVGESRLHLTAPGLNDANATTAKDVLEYVDSLQSEKDLSGSHNVSNYKTKEGQAVTVSSALVYTFYVENVSKEETGYYNLNFNVDSYVSPSSASVEPYTYLRVALFEKEYLQDGSGAEALTVYALPNTSGRGTFDRGENDRRECLSSFAPRDGTSLREATYTYDGNHGYCEPFAANLAIFNRRGLSLLASKTMRYTIAIWVEGEDPDCYGLPPKGTSFSFSMLFTAN